MTCSTLDCGMPAAAIVYPGIGPAALLAEADRKTPCRSCLPAAVERMVDAGQPFTVVPWRVLAGLVAA